MTLVDSFGRTINYLRISVTDRCNFRCVYCMPEAGAPVSPKDELLNNEELLRLIRIAVGEGMTKLRLTGGEPLIRKDIADLVAQIGSIPGVQELSMTTNGYLLPQYAAEFKRGGLDRINISLDTLQPDRFVKLARRGNLETVWNGIEKAIEVDLTPVKINCVVMRGYNEDEVADFARLTLNLPIHVRFIELMPIQWSTGENSQVGMNDFFAKSAPLGYVRNSNVTLYANANTGRTPSVLKERHGSESTMLNALEMRRSFVSASEMRRRIEEEVGVLSTSEITTNGPAQTFRLPRAQGTVGFISQVTQDFCRNCNRLRLTADGQLRPCLMADGEADLRSALRAGASDEAIAGIFRDVVLHKPFEHRLEDGKSPTSRHMSQLGG